MRTNWEQWGAASGLAAFAVGAAALIFERGPVSPNDNPTFLIWLIPASIVMIKRADHRTITHDGPPRPLRDR